MNKFKEKLDELWRKFPYELTVDSVMEIINEAKKEFEFVNHALYTYEPERQCNDAYKKLIKEWFGELKTE